MVAFSIDTRDDAVLLPPAMAPLHANKNVTTSITGGGVKTPHTTTKVSAAFTISIPRGKGPSTGTGIEDNLREIAILHGRMRYTHRKFGLFYKIVLPTFSFLRMPIDCNMLAMSYVQCTLVFIAFWEVASSLSESDPNT